MVDVSRPLILKQVAQNQENISMVWLPSYDSTGMYVEVNDSDV